MGERAASRDYRDLIAWQKAMGLVEAIYRATHSFPAEEQYGLTTQVRRAAISVPCNIAEGQGRRSPKEFSRFLMIAHGSVREVETQVLIAQRLSYLPEVDSNHLLELTAEVGRLISGLHRSLDRP